MIDGILDEFNTWKEEPAEIQSEFLNYFSGLFQSSNLSPDSIEEALVSLQPKVTDEMNAMLTHVFTKEEVRDALFQMNPNKAPGPYGFPVSFFQSYWTL